MSSSQRATQVSSDLWGGVFHSDNRGFYTALEFFALMSQVDPGWNTTDLQAHLDQQRLTVPGHILARRVAFDPDFDSAEHTAAFVLPDLVELVESLLSDLRVRIPGQGVRGRSWSGAHFVPYGQNLPHWDARQSRNRMRRERIYYRGAGTLAFRILCADPDTARRAETFSALASLLRRKHFLGHLLELFDEHEQRLELEADPTSTSSGGRVMTELSRVRGANDMWETLLLECVHAIATHDFAPGVVKLDGLFHIVPLIMSLMQVARSHEWMRERDPSLDARPTFVVDCSPPSSRTNEVRQAAHRSFARAQELLIATVRAAAQERGVKLSSGQVTQFRSYFTRGAPAIGLLNALTGARRFVLGPDLLEALVLATGNEEMTLESFIHDWLYGRFGFVIDERAARRHGLDREADLSVFGDNARFLADTLTGLGLLQSYSDATRMVRYGC